MIRFNITADWRNCWYSHLRSSNSDVLLLKWIIIPQWIRWASLPPGNWCPPLRNKQSCLHAAGLLLSWCMQEDSRGTHWGGAGRCNPGSRPSHAPGRRRPERRPTAWSRWRRRRARSWPRSPSLGAPSSPCFHLLQRASRDSLGACAVGGQQPHPEGCWSWEKFHLLQSQTHDLPLTAEKYEGYGKIFHLED